MVFWYAAVSCLAIMVISLFLWMVLLYHRQQDMQFELDKFKVWKTRVEAAASTLNTDLLEIMDTAHREKWNYTLVFDKITAAIERWAERFASLRKVGEE